MRKKTGAITTTKPKGMEGTQNLVEVVLTIEGMCNDPANQQCGFGAWRCGAECPRFGTRAQRRSLTVSAVELKGSTYWA